MAAAILVFVSAISVDAGVTNIFRGGPLYATIQAAVDAAFSGDYLRVTTGVYGYAVVSQKNLNINGRFHPSFMAKVYGGETRITTSASVPCMEVVSSVVTITDIRLTEGGGVGSFTPMPPTFTINHGGGMYAYMSTVSLLSCLIDSNVANVGGGVDAVYSSILMSNTTVRENRAVGLMTIGGEGGGINANDSMVTIQGEDGDLLDNSSIRGGGINASYSTVIVEQQADICGNSAKLVGGGVALEYSTCIVRNAGSFIGGAAPLGPNSATNHGGGLYAENSAVIISNFAMVAHNAALKNGGGVWLSNSTLIVTHGAAIGYPAPVAQAYTNYAGGNGGSVYARDSTVIVTNGFICSGNAATGGGIYAELSDVSLRAGAVLGHAGTTAVNRARSVGGGMFALNGTVDMVGASILNNVSASHGAGIYCRHGSFECRSSSWPETERAEAALVARCCCMGQFRTGHSTRASL